MILAIVILVLSTALFFFYVQNTCRRILARQFDQNYFESIVNANRLEFTSVETALREFNTPVDYPWVRLTLKCDFLALTYLLKHASNPAKRFSRDDRLLIFYFRTTLVALGLCHLMGLGEKQTILRLTKILKFFANVVGRRVSTARFGNLTVSDYLLSI